MNYKKYSKYLITWLQAQVKKANKQGLIVGLSGGIDSALVGALAQKAFPQNSLGVSLEINDMLQDLEHINLLVKNINIKKMDIKLLKIYKQILKDLPIEDKLSKANIKPRLRMLSLYALAQEKNYLVLGTDNAAELYLGYFTKFGDGAADLLPIIHLTKTDVREMAKVLNVPNEIIIKKSSAGLWDNQYDEDELGFSYNNVDAFLKNLEIDKKIEKKILKQHRSTNHKRDKIPIPKSYDKLK